MTGPCLTWNNVICKNVRGEDYSSTFPDYLNRINKGQLLERIQKMPRRNPISLERAVNIVIQRRIKAFDDENVNLIIWYQNNFLEYISQLGFHIELTGDEFELSIQNTQEA